MHYMDYIIMIRFDKIDIYLVSWRHNDSFDDSNVLKYDNGKIVTFDSDKKAIEFIKNNFDEELVNPFLFEREKIEDKEPDGYKFSKGFIAKRG